MLLALVLDENMHDGDWMAAKCLKIRLRNTPGLRKMKVAGTILAEGIGEPVTYVPSGNIRILLVTPCQRQAVEACLDYEAKVADGSNDAGIGSVRGERGRIG